MNLGTKTVIGLAAGLASGAAIAAADRPALLAAGAAVEVCGTIWINAILMTILPLVVAKLVVSIAGHDDARAVGRSGWRAGLLFIGLLTATAAVSSVIMPAGFAPLRIDPAASETLRSAASASVSAPARPTAAQWVTSLVPTNAIRAATDGFGARTGGSVILYGSMNLGIGLFLASGFDQVVHLFPRPVLGVILLFEALTLIGLVRDTAPGKADFSIVVLVGLFAVNLPYGYVVGMVAGALLALLTKRGVAGLAR